MTERCLDRWDARRYHEHPVRRRPRRRRSQGDPAAHSCAGKYGAADEPACRAENSALVVYPRQRRTDKAFQWAIEWARHLASDTPSDVERFDDSPEYLVTVGFVEEKTALR